MTKPVKNIIKTFEVDIQTSVTQVEQTLTPYFRQKLQTYKVNHYKSQAFYKKPGFLNMIHGFQ